MDEKVVHACRNGGYDLEFKLDSPKIGLYGVYAMTDLGAAKREHDMSTKPLRHVSYRKHVRSTARKGGV